MSTSIYLKILQTLLLMEIIGDLCNGECGPWITEPRLFLLLKEGSGLIPTTLSTQRIYPFIDLLSRHILGYLTLVSDLGFPPDIHQFLAYPPVRHINSGCFTSLWTPY